MIKVISLGGSIVAPDSVDTDFLVRLTELFRSYLREFPARKLVIVVGGGGPARQYQAAYRRIVPHADSDTQDWIGIAATRLNGELLRGLFPEECREPLVTDPTAAGLFSGRILVAAGWKPGFSSDYDAVILAERFEADTVINLSNVSKVYTADPKKDPTAKPIETISWEDFRKLVGNDWTPGKNLPFDPIAARRAQELRLRVIAAAGKNLENLNNLLTDRPFEGTTIGPG